MAESLFLFILLIHFLADFGLQTHEQAQLKSTQWKPLFYHVGVYSMIWFIAVLSLINDPLIAFYFSIITFVCHYLTDYTTSRISKGFFDKGDMHNGFVVVGFDQVLHYLQLFYTFKLLTNG